MSKTSSLTAIGTDAVALAKKKGAGEACAAVHRVREISIDWRDGKLEKIHEATTRGLSLRLFVDGRYAAASTSDLRPEALETFVQESIAVARTLAKDPFRALPEPALYAGQAAVDLKIHDARYAEVSPEQRLRLAKEIEAACRAVPGHEAIDSVTSGVSDILSETALVCSNGFEGSRADTQFWAGAEVSAKDPDGRKPQDGRTWAGASSRSCRPRPRSGRRPRSARSRASARRRPNPRCFPMVLDNRAGGRLVGSLFQALSGGDAPAEAVLPRGKARAGGRKRAPRRDGRPAAPEGARVPPLRRRRDRGEAAADLHRRAS